MTNLKFTVDPTALVHPRRIDAADALVALTQIVASAPGLRSHVGTGLVQVFTGLIERAEALRAELQSLAREWEPELTGVPLEPPAALLAIVPREVLVDARAVDNLIDALVRSLDLQIAGAVGGPEAHARTRAATLLRERLFPTGRDFLQLTFARQWSEVNNRFDGLSAPIREAIVTLGLGEHVAEIVALNAWFGRLVGVTERPGVAADAQVEPHDRGAAVADALARALGLAVELLAFANLAWPGSDAANAARRVELVGAYLVPVQRLSEARSQLIKQRATVSPAPTPV